MKRLVLAIAAATALGMGGGIAGQAVAAPTCHDTGSADTRYLAFEADDNAVREGLKVSFRLGLEPAQFPADDIAKNRDACRRGQVAVNGTPVQIYGDDKDTPPRWATAPDGRIAYFALTPDPFEALEWSKAPHKDGDATVSFKSMIYLLVVTDGDRRLIYSATRKLPDDYHLASQLRAALEKRWTPFAVMDLKTGAVDLDHLELAATQSVAAGLAKEPKTFTQPDGEFFVAQADGGALHARSGLNCPARVGPYERNDMAVLNPADGGVDLMCRYFSPGSWFSVFDTLYHNASLDSVLAGYVKEAQGVTPPQRVLSPPGPLKTALAYKATFWVGKEGGYQGLWVVKRGEWYIELRATYKPGEEAAVAAFAQRMFDLLAASSA
jgi:hypothetical protein